MGVAAPAGRSQRPGPKGTLAAPLVRSGSADFDQDIVNCKRQHLDDRLDVRLRHGRQHIRGAVTKAKHRRATSVDVVLAGTAAQTNAGSGSATGRCDDGAMRNLRYGRCSVAWAAEVSLAGGAARARSLRSTWRSTASGSGVSRQRDMPSLSGTTGGS